MTFGRLDCWKKQNFTHEIATKNKKLHTSDNKKTQNCTLEKKITYQATKKTIKLRTLKHKIVNQIATKKTTKKSHTKL